MLRMKVALIVDDANTMLNDVNWEVKPPNYDTSLPAGNVVTIINRVAKLFAPVVFCSTRFSESQITSLMIGSKPALKIGSSSNLVIPLAPIYRSEVMQFLGLFINNMNKIDNHTATLISCFLQGRPRLSQIFMECLHEYNGPKVSCNELFKRYVVLCSLFCC